MIHFRAAPGCTIELTAGRLKWQIEGISGTSYFRDSKEDGHTVADAEKDLNVK